MFLERKLNSFDELQLSLQASDPAVQYFVLDAIIEVWRRIDRVGAAFYRETTLLHRTEQRELSTEQQEIFVSFSRGLNDFLRRRHIQYFSTTAYTLKQGPADNIMKQFVVENAGPGANIAARKSFGQWNAIIPGLTVEANTSLAPEWRGARAWDNLLDVLNEMAQVSSVDFNIERTGPLTFEFRTYYPQLGTDRSNFIIFSPQLGNMTDVSYSKSRSEEATAVIVGGQGEGTDRRIYPLLNANAADDSPWNIIETHADGRSQAELADLLAIAEESLNEKALGETFMFRVLQTDSRQYGSEYFLGDKVKAKYRNIEIIKKIVKASFKVSEGREEIDIEFDEQLS